MKWFFATAAIIFLSLIFERPAKVSSQSNKSSDTIIGYLAKRDFENKAIIKRLAKKQDASLTNLSDVKEKVDNLPKTKIIYKTRWRTNTIIIHDTTEVPAIPFDANEYTEEPVIKYDTAIIHDTIAMTKKQIRNFNRHKN